jgi:hypothetical protein
MTYSILGWAEGTGDLGVAVQSRLPGVGNLVPYGAAEVGIVGNQGFGNPRHGPSGALDDRRAVISVSHHQHPIDELLRCYALHRLSSFPSDPSELVPVGPELGSENYDNRINDGVAVDVEVLADLGRTYGRRPAG